MCEQYVQPIFPAAELSARSHLHLHHGAHRHRGQSAILCLGAHRRTRCHVPPHVKDHVAIPAVITCRCSFDAAQRAVKLSTRVHHVVLSTDGIGIPDPNPIHLVNWCFE